MITEILIVIALLWAMIGFCRKARKQIDAAYRGYRN
jgi:hypothetical protein